MSPPTIAQPIIQETHLRTNNRMRPVANGQADAFRQSLRTHVNNHKADEANLKRIIHKAAQSNGLDPGLIRAVIQAQSNCDPKAISPAGAQGLMQLMPETAAELGITDAFDPEQNVMGASRYLKSLVDRYDGDMGRALRAYTWGMGNVDRNPNPPPLEVERFVAKVSAAASLGVATERTPTSTLLAEMSAAVQIRPEQTFRLDAVQYKAKRSGVDGIIHQAAQHYKLNPDLIAAVIHTESNFDKNAVSHAGAQGLMQLMPATAAELGVTNPFDPEQNIMGASRYLKGLVERYDGDLRLALAAYNWGMGNLERHPGRLPAETSNYIAKVLALIPTEVKYTVATGEMTPAAEQRSRQVGQEAISPDKISPTIGQATQAYAPDSLRIKTSV
ncbi:Transglycosylase SLT domain-containing protein [Mariprofundus aestuarium]|uniref:Transglycosylase SLT domain-containing protein n=1 Tax=Mariprofundus aestuarium TaxID=1921086 RepID=A0A2K8KV74_MARES|nr:lytic transglycosylase domain-containing protein [Mariprofundus aestuarium]ATX78623.1 Transglycosylase SLT domain-containing protein [Mariprofundus aestuarium]